MSCILLRVCNLCMVWCERVFSLLYYFAALVQNKLCDEDHVVLMTNRYECSEQLVVSHICLDILSAHLLFQAVLRIRLKDLVKLYMVYIWRSVIHAVNHYHLLGLLTKQSSMIQNNNNNNNNNNTKIYNAHIHT